jgi:hypothetical protein
MVPLANSGKTSRVNAVVIAIFSCRDRARSTVTMMWQTFAQYLIEIDIGRRAFKVAATHVLPKL